MTISGQPLRQNQTIATILTIAWHRAWAFTGILRRDTRARVTRSKSWTWQWGVVALQAVFLYPVRLIYTAATIDQTWINADRSGSARVRLLQGRRHRSPVGQIIVVLVSVFVAALFLGALVLSAVGPPWAGIAAGCVLLLAVAIMLASVAGQHTIPAATLAEMTAGRAAAVLTDVVTTPQGAGLGKAFMQQLQQQWKQAGLQIAVLHAGCDDLIGFYTNHHWSTHSGRTMTWGATPATDTARNPQQRDRIRDDSGSAGGFALIALVAAIGLMVVFGLVVDGGTKAGALDRANRIAMEAAAAGAQVLTRQGSVDATVQSYLAAEGVTGTVSIDGDRVNVSVNLSEPTKVLSMIGITQINVNGTGFAYAIYRDAEG